MIFPSTDHRPIYASLLAVTAAFILAASFLYLRCLTLSVGWIAKVKHPKTKFHLLSTLSEEEIEDTLYQIVRSFRRGNTCFFLSFFGAFVLLGMVAFGQLNMLPQ